MKKIINRDLDQDKATAAGDVYYFGTGMRCNQNESAVKKS